jgi:hypothetical protein
MYVNTKHAYIWTHKHAYIWTPTHTCVTTSTSIFAAGMCVCVCVLCVCGCVNIIHLLTTIPTYIHTQGTSTAYNIQGQSKKFSVLGSPALPTHQPHIDAQQQQTQNQNQHTHTHPITTLDSPRTDYPPSIAPSPNKSENGSAHRDDDDNFSNAPPRRVNSNPYDRVPMPYSILPDRAGNGMNMDRVGNSDRVNVGSPAPHPRKGGSCSSVNGASVGPVSMSMGIPGVDYVTVGINGALICGWLHKETRTAFQVCLCVCVCVFV